jgi:hypothetical protein
LASLIHSEQAPGRSSTLNRLPGRERLGGDGKDPWTHGGSGCGADSCYPPSTRSGLPPSLKTESRGDCSPRSTIS